MRQDLRPQPAETVKQRAPGYFSNWLFAISIIAGIVLGLGVTRHHGPLQQSNAEPWQLLDRERDHYMVAIALEYAESSDLTRALHKLIALRPAQEPLKELADAACALGSRGYLINESGIRALRSMVKLYAPQGRAGCAEQLLPEETVDTEAKADTVQVDNAARPTPQPTKAPLPADGQRTSSRSNRPVPTPQRTFELRPVRSFCDLSRPAIIEVYVVDYIGRGIPGQRVRARWGNNEEFFVSGLKIDRGDAYADFQMQDGVDYAIDMPGANSASLSTGVCYSENRQTLKSYRVTFVET